MCVHCCGCLFVPPVLYVRVCKVVESVCVCVHCGGNEVIAVAGRGGCWLIPAVINISGSVRG